jgi:hypothetical protein
VERLLYRVRVREKGGREKERLFDLNTGVLQLDRKAQVYAVLCPSRLLRVVL